MEKIYNTLATTDATVIGTPAYYESASSQLKLLVDRSDCLREMIPFPDGRITFKTRIEKKREDFHLDS